MSAVNKLKRSKAPILDKGLSSPVFVGVSVKHSILDESTAMDCLSSILISGSGGSCMVIKYLAGNDYTIIPRKMVPLI
jgi:hypothetical protein